MAGTPLLAVRDLTVEFDTGRGSIEAVSGVSFDIAAGETVGVVGESGAGKSVTARSVMNLIESPPGRITGGEVRFKGRDVLAMDDRERRSILGNEMAMMFQEPSAALNPAYSVGEQIAETVRVHWDVSRGEAWERAVEMLDDVGIPDPEARADEYPHQFSGGMQQRAWLAVALSCEPDLLLADEPTTALDVTTQAKILELLADLQEKYGLSLLFITHDLNLTFDFCDRINIMYAGEIVETGSTRELYERPKHPYVLGLVNSIPSRNERKQPLPAIDGVMPAPGTEPSGCAFRTRCPFAEGVCASDEPALRHVGAEPDHEAACYLYGEIDRDQEEITWRS